METKGGSIGLRRTRRMHEDLSLSLSESILNKEQVKMISSLLGNQVILDRLPEIDLSEIKNAQSKQEDNAIILKTIDDIIKNIN